MADVIKENPKDALWIVVVQSAHSAGPGLVLAANGKPALEVVTHHPSCEATVHAPDAETAEAFILQQNPGAKVVSVTAAAP